jgi:hypothetical protein
MNRSLPKSVAALGAFVSLTSVVGCSADSDSNSDVLASSTQHETAAQGCLTYAQAKANFDREVQAAKDHLQADYDAAMAQFNAGVAQAKADMQAILASLPENSTSNESAEILNKAVSDYNAKVAPGGPLDQAYNAAVAAAQAKYNASTQAATDEFNRNVCH